MKVQVSGHRSLAFKLFMYLRSGHWYSSGRVNQATGASLKSSEESVTNSYHALSPVIEEEKKKKENENFSSDMNLKFH